MNAKIEPGGHGRVQYLLRCAFMAADEGDSVEAMHYWHTAIKEGYIAKERTHKQLLFRIREGESKASGDARSSLDLANPADARELERLQTEMPDLAVTPGDPPTVEPIRTLQDRVRAKLAGKTILRSTPMPEGPFNRMWRMGEDKPKS